MKSEGFTQLHSFMPFHHISLSISLIPLNMYISHENIQTEDDENSLTTLF